jgi:hypothetical protein
MLKKQAGNSAELPYQANTKCLEHQHCETARQVYQIIHTSGLNQFTYPLIDSWWKDLNAIVFHLEHLPEEAFNEFMAVIEGLGEARNELRHALFLFDVEEINSVHRLVMRNRAVLRGDSILQKILMIWPSQISS